MTCGCFSGRGAFEPAGFKLLRRGVSQQQGEPACRLLNLIGPGGIGKTCLAIEAARRQAQVSDRFTDGIWFIDAAAAPNPGNLPVVVLHCLGIPNVGTPSQPRLLVYLGWLTAADRRGIRRQYRTE